MEKNELEISITLPSVLKYALPTILANIFTNIYGLVDQLFVSNLVGTEGFSAVSIFYPVVSIAMAVGIMVSTGGSALVAKKLGEGKHREARGLFSFLMVFTFSTGLIFCLLALAFRVPLMRLLGADEVLLPYCLAYAEPYLLCLPLAMGGMFFSMFYIASGHPRWGFIFSTIGGALNIILDWLLIPRMGVSGAAWASSMGYTFQAVAGICFFSFFRAGLLFVTRPLFSLGSLAKSATNGASEMVSVLSTSLVMIVMNLLLMKLAGPDGVASAAIALTANILLTASFMGYSQGIAPLISYNYGKQDEDALKGLYRIAMRTLQVSSAVIFLLSLILAQPVAYVFTRESLVVSMAVRGTRIFAFASLLMGFNVFSSSLFTALNDGRTSAAISFCRTFLFLLAPLLLLPAFFGTNGIWLSLPVAEALSFILSTYFRRRKAKEYLYA